MTNDNKPAGLIEISAQKTVKERVSYTLDLKCENVKDLEWFSKSDPCLRIYRPRPAFMGRKDVDKIPDQEWVKVHETEYKKDDLNPDFAPFTISDDKLCRGNEDQPLKMEIWDFSKEGEGSMNRIGKAYFTMRQITTDNLLKFVTIDAKGKPAGTIVV